MKNVIVKTQALKKYYQTGNQTVRALDGVNFEVAEREFVSIIGKSGSGKSTLIDIIMDPEKYVFDGNVEMEPNLKMK